MISWRTPWLPIYSGEETVRVVWHTGITSIGKINWKAVQHRGKSATQSKKWKLTKSIRSNVVGISAKSIELWDIGAVERSKLRNRFSTFEHWPKADDLESIITIRLKIETYGMRMQVVSLECFPKGICEVLGMQCHLEWQLAAWIRA